jgi:hypothetical protein
LRIGSVDSVLYFLEWKALIRTHNQLRDPLIERASSMSYCVAYGEFLDDAGDTLHGRAFEGEH